MSKKNTRYVIQDWAGNLMFGGKTFKSFDDAWSFIYDQFRDRQDAEEIFQDLFVEKES